MKISTEDRFQALLRVPEVIQKFKHCKTVLDFILEIEKQCDIKSDPGSPWVKDLIRQAKRVRVTKRA